MFAALNIAYEEPERRSLLRFYLSAFTFAILGILSGALMLLAIVYVPILFAYAGYSDDVRDHGEGGALAAACAHRAHPARAAVPLRSMPAERQMALGDGGLGVRHRALADRFGRLLFLCVALRQL